MINSEILEYESFTSKSNLNNNSSNNYNTNLAKKNGGSSVCVNKDSGQDVIIKPEFTSDLVFSDIVPDYEVGVRKIEKRMTMKEETDKNSLQLRPAIASNFISSEI